MFWTPTDYYYYYCFCFCNCDGMSIWQEWEQTDNKVNRISVEKPEGHKLGRPKLEGMITLKCKFKNVFSPLSMGRICATSSQWILSLPNSVLRTEKSIRNYAWGRNVRARGRCRWTFVHGAYFRGVSIAQLMIHCTLVMHVRAQRWWLSSLAIHINPSQW
jgi:hypothetical protein